MPPPFDAPKRLRRRSVGGQWRVDRGGNARRGARRPGEAAASAEDRQQPDEADSAADRLHLRKWIHSRLRLSARQETALVRRIDDLLLRRQRTWQRSKQEAIAAVTRGYAARAETLRRQLAAVDATAAAVAQTFEALVADLVDRINRDPKTRLLHGGAFLDRVASYLAIEQRGRWCAVGLVDIRSFKAYNDTLGHLLGDRIIERVASLLAEHTRPDDLIAADASEAMQIPARFGGDEFCFFVPQLDQPESALHIAERFRRAVGAYDWAALDDRLQSAPVTVDVGVAVLLLGAVAERKRASRQLALQLLDRADQLMYQAKTTHAQQAVHREFQVEGDHVREIESPATSLRTP